MKRFFRAGATLIEMTVVIALLAIVSAIAVPSISAFIIDSKMVELNSDAKSIFLAAQGYLSTAAAGGGLEEINKEADGAVTSTILPDDPENKDQLVYMQMSRNGADNDMLRKMLDAYLTDKEVLNYNINLEYNKITGHVYSVCYSESADYFVYEGGTGSRAGAVSVIDRNPDTRRSLMFGYYGAMTNAAAPNRQQLKDVSVELVNAERLYLKWTDAEPDISFDETIVYTIRLFGEDNAEIMSIDIPAASVEAAAGGEGFNASNELKRFQLALKIRAPGSERDGAAWVYQNAGMEGGYRYFLVLDAIDTSVAPDAPVSPDYATTWPGYGVAERYPELENKNIYATVTAVSDINDPSEESLPSNIEHTYYTRLADDGAGYSQSDVDAGYNGVKFARHLHNLRFGEDVYKFKQTADLDWKACVDGAFVIQDGAIAKGDAVSFQSLITKDETKNIIFDGEYAGNGNNIDNFVVRPVDKDQKRPAGLFAETATQANLHDFNVAGLKLEVESGETLRVGGIAGMNQGAISNVHVTGSTVRGLVKPPNPGDRTCVGGIAGENSGNIFECSFGAGEGAKALLEGVDNVGGIAGVNSGAGEGDNGVISKCSTSGGLIRAGILPKEGVPNEDQNLDEIFGRNVGGIIGLNEVKTVVTLDGLKNGASVIGNAYVGGIIGLNGKIGGGASDSNPPAIENCENTGLVTALVNYGGGITGYNTGIIKSCASSFKGEIADALPEGVSQERAQSGDFIGGIAGYNNGTIQGTRDKRMESSAAVIGNNYVGGFIGQNDTQGKVNYCAVTGGVVMAKGNFAGGFTGLNTSLNSLTGQGNRGNEMYASPEKVEGNMFVGGILGANLVALRGADSLTIIGNMGSEGLKAGTDVVATAFAGGIVGYNGVVNGQDSLEQTLKELNAIKPFEYEWKDPDSDNVPVTTISLSYNLANVTADRYVGGIIGYNSPQSRLDITKCVNLGSLSVDTENNKSRTDEDFFYIGGITGRNSIMGNIRQCTNSGSVASLSKYAGGIVEVNEGTILKCKNDSTVKSTKSNVGGIAGLNGTPYGEGEKPQRPSGKLAKIEGSFSTSASRIEGVNNLGGIAGENGGVISLCVARGSIRGTGINIGGITGYNNPVSRFEGNATKKDDRSSNPVRIEGSMNVGGLIGYNASEMELAMLLNFADVKGDSFVGGIVGRNDSESKIIKQCANYGSVEGASNVGGITGRNGGFDLDNPQTDSNYVIEECANFGDVTGAGGVKSFVGGIVSENYGVLIDCVAGSSATGVNRKTTVTGVGASAGGLLGANYGQIRVTANTLNINIQVVKDEAFSTDGDDMPTENVTVEAGNPYMLRSNVAKQAGTGGGTVYLGGLMAQNFSDTLKTITGYTMTGNMSAAGGAAVGGILGLNREGDTITGCSFTGNITNLNGSSGTGGITGVNNGEIYGVYDQAVLSSMGALSSTIAGNQNVGGIAGINTGYLHDCNSGGATADPKGGMNIFFAPRVTGARAVGGAVGLHKPAGAGDAYNLYNINNYASVGNPASGENCSYAGGVAGEVSTSSGVKRDGGDKGRAQSVPGEISGMEGLKIYNCQNFGEIRGSGSAFAGIVGGASLNASQGKLVIYDCVNKPGGWDTMAGGSGGIAGVLKHAKADGITVLNCSNERGLLNRISNNLGGIVGSAQNNVKIKNCVNTGNVKQDRSGNTKPGVAGGIAGAMSGAGIIEGCYSGDRNASPYGEQPEISTLHNVAGGIVGSLGTGDITITDSTNVSKVNAYGYHTAGGIVGYVGGSGTKLIENCKNGDGPPNAHTSSTFSIGKQNMGGIVGDASAPVTIRSCSNFSEFDFKGGSSVGGIVGRANTSSGQIVITGCVNTPDSWKGLNANTVGGIAGYAGQGVVISDCQSLGSDLQSSNSNVGGIAGILSGNAHIDGSLGAVVNSAAITCDSNGGGIAGTVSGGAKITGAENGARGGSGAVYANGSNAGGIAGKIDQANQNHIAIDNCTSYGQIRAKRNSGGIAGEIASGVVANCDVKNITTNIMITGEENVGGVVGIISEKGIAYNCTNEIPLGSGSSSVYGKNVGGIAGTNMGQIYSCSNTANITGITNVGGIAGKNIAKANSLGVINSDVASSANITSNTGAVTANGQSGVVGGIVGYNAGGEVLRSYNTGAVGATVGSHRAGGVVGFMQTAKSDVDAVDNARGRIAACFNTGDLGMGSSGVYIGGVAGYRAQKSVDDITDSFVDYAKVPVTDPGVSGRWGVGNEPVAADNGKYDMTSTHINPADIAGIENYIRVYVLPLLPPNDITLTVPDPAAKNTYNVKWSAVQGEVASYEVKIEFEGGGVVTASVPPEKLEAEVSLEGNAGKKISKVTVTAKGDGPHSKDSSAGEQPIDPQVLVKPKQMTPGAGFTPPPAATYGNLFTLTPVSGSGSVSTYRLTLTESAMKAYADNNPKTANPSLAAATAYDSYFNGLEKIIVTLDGNGLGAKAGELTFSNDTGAWVCAGADIAFNLGNQAQKDFHIHLYAVPKGGGGYDGYDYLISDPSDTVATIKKVGKISLPSITSAAYTGEADEATAEYTIFWNRPNENYGSIASYTVSFKLSDGAVVWTADIPYTNNANPSIKANFHDPANFANKAGGGKYSLADLYGQTLGVSVKANSGDPTVMVSSDESVSSVTVPVKLPAPKDAAFASVANIPAGDVLKYDAEYTVSWGEAADPSNPYGAQQKFNALIMKGTATAANIEDTAEKSHIIKCAIGEEIPGYDIYAQISAAGIAGTSFTSELNAGSAAAIGRIPARLPAMGAPIYSGDSLSWQKPADVSNVAGYIIYGSSISGEFVVLAEIDSPDTLRYDGIKTAMGVKMPGVNNANVYVVAKSSDKSANLNSQALNGVIIWRVALNAPTNVTLNPAAIAGELSAADFAAAKYNVNWVRPADVAGTVRTGYSAEILSSAGASLASNSNISPDATNVELGGLGVEYAGQTVSARVMALGQSAGNSEWATSPNITLPKLKLADVTGLTVAPGPTAGYAATWTDINLSDATIAPWVTGYEISVTDNVTATYANISHGGSKNNPAVVDKAAAAGGFGFEFDTSAASAPTSFTVSVKALGDGTHSADSGGAAYSYPVIRALPSAKNEAGAVIYDFSAAGAPSVFSAASPPPFDRVIIEFAGRPELNFELPLKEDGSYGGREVIFRAPGDYLINVRYAHVISDGSGNGVYEFSPVVSCMTLNVPAFAPPSPEPVATAGPSAKPTETPESGPDVTPGPSPTGSPGPSPTGSPEPSPAASPEPSPAGSPGPSPDEPGTPGNITAGGDGDVDNV